MTSKGSILVELYPDKAPKTVESFLANVASGFYDGTIFHRVIPGFMIQGGGFHPDLTLKPPPGLLENEADNGLSNRRGTLAMARRPEPHTASVQFFINQVDNLGLDHRAKTDGRSWGYTVFGRVLEGMDVVDAIASVRTTQRGSMGNVPLEAITIEKATQLDAGHGEETRQSAE